MATAISFDGNSLQTANIYTATIGHESITSKLAPIYALGHANRSVIPFVSYPSKLIVISGTITGSDIPNLDSRLDNFRAYFADTDSNLDIDYNGSTRRYIATATKVTVDRPYGLQFAKFTVEFTCTQAFGQDTSTTNAVSATGRTSSSYTDGVTFNGNAPWQSPVLTYNYTTVTGGTAKTVIIGNADTGQQIQVTRDWSSSDVLAIDTYNKTVKVNGVDVSYTGAFPEFQPGAGNITYADNFTTRNFAVSADYYARYF